MSRKLLNALYANDASKANKIFKSAIQDKRHEALEVKKVAVAAEVFNKKD
tara:strand:- start:201 stop:350 length:150 start_codon:yes stop_codon:yes gene_type:complete